MNILSHRGYWVEPCEKNTEIAFRRSFELGFGTETDVRDCQGRLVISHDMPHGGEMDLEDFLRIYGQKTLPLAINVKADGLAVPLNQAMRTAGVRNWFVFDMSVPDMRSYLQTSVPVFARMSEVEKTPAWLEQVTGIWLDAFSETWYEAGLISDLLKKGKQICVVSPELHGRDPAPLWNMLRPFSAVSSLMICTDYPERAQEFFGRT